MPPVYLKLFVLGSLLIARVMFHVGHRAFIVPVRRTGDIQPCQ